MSEDQEAYAEEMQRRQWNAAQRAEHGPIPMPASLAQQATLDQDVCRQQQAEIAFLRQQLAEQERQRQRATEEKQLRIAVLQLALQAGSDGLPRDADDIVEAARAFLAFTLERG